MHFDKCKHPCNHHSKQDIDYSHHSKKLPLPLPSHFYVYTHSETITVVNSSIAVDQFYLFLNFICRGSYIFSLLHLGGHTSISGSTPEEIKRLKTTLKKWEKNYKTILTAVFLYLAVFIQISTVMYFHHPSALNHLSQTVFSSRKILICFKTSKIFPWCGLACYAYYVFLKQIALVSTSM